MVKKIALFLALSLFIIPFSAMALTVEDVPSDILIRPRIIDSEYKNWILVEVKMLNKDTNYFEIHKAYLASTSDLKLRYNDKHDPRMEVFVSSPYGLFVYNINRKGVDYPQPTTIFNSESGALLLGTINTSLDFQLHIIKYSGQVAFEYGDGTALDPDDYLLSPSSWGDSFESFFKVFKPIVNYIISNWVFLLFLMPGVIALGFQIYRKVRN